MTTLHARCVCGLNKEKVGGGVTGWGPDRNGVPREVLFYLRPENGSIRC